LETTRISLPKIMLSTRNDRGYKCSIIFPNGGDKVRKREIAISKELTLALLLSRRKAVFNIDNYLNGEEIKAILNSKIDWLAFSQNAVLHEFVSPIYVSLNKINSSNIPAIVKEKFREAYDKRRNKTAKLSAELLQIIDIFQTYKLRFFILKGLPLALEIYNDTSLRSSSDIDILIHKDDMEKASEILLTIGYKPIHVKNKNMIGHHHTVLINNNNNIAIELHWKLIKDQFFISSNKPSSIFYFDNLWSNKRQVFFYSREINMFSIEDELIYLIYHATTHYFIDLKWLGDIYELLCKNERIYLDELIIKAKLSGMQKPLAVCLMLCSAYLGLDLKPIILNSNSTAFKKLLRSTKVKNITYIISELINYNHKFVYKYKRSLPYTTKVLCYHIIFKIYFGNKLHLMPLLNYELKRNIDIVVSKINRMIMQS
jgi:hypothetical protein